MKRLLLLFICILIPFPGFGETWFPLCQTGPEAHERDNATVGPLKLFPSDAGGPSLNIQQTTNHRRKEHPHLIELTSNNWRPLTNVEKFGLFEHDLLHWGTHVSIALDSGLSMVTRDRPNLGNGAKGYFTRYGLNLADEANFCFFNASLFPVIFHQDPRYIPRDHGSTASRAAYALSRILITRSDSGKPAVNESNILGMLVSTSISSAMYSSYGADIGIGGNFVAFGYNMMSEAAFNLLKEFWPDVARKMKLNLWIRNIVRASLRDYVRVS